MNDLRIRTGVLSMALAASLLVGGGTTSAQPVDIGLPVPCGAECLQTALEAVAACKEAGGNLLECAPVFLETLTQCRADAGCETPERPPVCGEECLSAARTAVAACREAGGDLEACLAEVKAQLHSCVEAAGCEIPAPPGGALRCGLECLKSSLGVARECLQGGGNLHDCAGAFRTAFEECRATSECGQPEEPPPPAEEEAVLLPLLLEDPFIRGDANVDGSVDISDAIGILGHLFLGNETPGCADAADATDDGTIDIADPVLVLVRLFRDAESGLPAPYPESGFDPTEDGVTCGVTGN